MITWVFPSVSFSVRYFIAGGGTGRTGLTPTGRSRDRTRSLFLSRESSRSRRRLSPLSRDLDLLRLGDLLLLLLRGIFYQIWKYCFVKDSRFSTFHWPSTNNWIITLVQENILMTNFIRMITVMSHKEQFPCHDLSLKMKGEKGKTGRSWDSHWFCLLLTQSSVPRSILNRPKSTKTLKLMNFWVINFFR